SQGGMLDIHDYNGQRALAAAGLSNEFRSIIHAGGQATRVLDRHGTVLLDQPDDGTGLRPEVHRGELRRILLDSLAPGTVQWGRKLAAVEPCGPRGDGAHALRFADGSTAAANLVVGADGAWSKVRARVSEVRPAYLGTAYFETYLLDADARHPASARLVGGGSMISLAPGQGIVSHREPGGVLHTYVALTRPRDWADAIDVSDDRAARARIAAEFAGWAPELVALITDGETALVPRMLHALPLGQRWPRTPGLTLIGDAAHLAPPDGEGANLAMYDGAELGQAIAAQPRELDAAIAVYEDAMFARSATAGAEAAATHALCYDDADAPHGLVAFLRGATS
ncbi:MAG TPA: FAD-dependent monooxygenase, partial [Kofleriaceae bacterium]